MYRVPIAHGHALRTTDILSAGLDSGVAISVILIFFALQYPKNGTIGETTLATWWGNTVGINTADANSSPLWPIPAVGYFGPPPGSW